MLNRKREISCLLLVACCGTLLQGCATVLSDRKYPVTFDNTGGQTYFMVRDKKNEVVHQGVTPAQVTLDAKSLPFIPAKYSVTFAGSGEFSQHRELKAGFDPWIAGNILLGGVPGAVIDGATGAMFKLPKQVTGDVPSQYAVQDLAQGAKIAAIQSEAVKPSDPSQTSLQQVEYQAAIDSTTSAK